MDMMATKCRKCGSVDLTIRNVGEHTGLYCCKCGAWQKWLSKDEIRANSMHPSMSSREYQRLAMRTATDKCRNVLNAALGLAGEAGEVADEIKKSSFQGHPWDPVRIIEELGDVLWYVTLMADIFGVKLEKVMELNIEKLKKRYPDGFSPEASVNREENNEVPKETCCG